MTVLSALLVLALIVTGLMAMTGRWQPFAVVAVVLVLFVIYAESTKPEHCDREFAAAVYEECR